MSLGTDSINDPAPTLDDLENQILDLQAQQQQMQRERDRVANETLLRGEARPQINAILQSLGLNESACIEITRALGGISKFVQKDEHGRLTMDVGGQSMPIAEGLPMHPVVTALLQSGNAAAFASPVVLAKNRISQIDAEINEAKAAFNRDRSNAHLMRVSILQKERKKLFDEVAAATQPAPVRKITDPRLLAERRRLQAEVDAAAQRWQSTRCTNMKYFTEYNDAKKRLHAVLQQIG